ncbi:succinate dehydrogenase assembly factor 2 [uncultured Ferrovibrio sp.]|jgi:antitoxin CptB|uniref:succinate dehydrogenase assembly factor 2 n=1 Tax=uncultured Ferrovibrio sp. TaxID=1576913 RepID=UPI00261347D2|nr:succinate dehydrogenase assembly factor 2 [uncultured Ferrovibrio sp.]
MTEIQREDIETRRKRLLHRSLYTGMKEVDILLGGFARQHLPTFTEQELDQYETLLKNYDDPQIYAWAIGREPVPPHLDNGVMKLLKAYKLPF